MPVKIQYLDGGKGVSFTVTGTITAEEFVKANEEIYSRDLRAEPYLYCLVDFDSVQAIQAAAADVRRVANQDLAASKDMPATVIAVYAKGDLPFALARMWQVFVEAANWDTKVFRSRADAVAWLKQRVLDRFGFRATVE